MMTYVTIAVSALAVVGALLSIYYTRQTVKLRRQAEANWREAEANWREAEANWRKVAEMRRRQS